MTNKLILEKLQILHDQYIKNTKLKFKASALKKAIHNITNAPEISSGSQAKKYIDGIGDGIANRIDEIILTGTLSEILINNLPNEELEILNMLKNVTGIGEHRAKELYSQNIKSIKELRNSISNGKVKSTHHIDIGLKYYDDLKLKIPRDEIKEMKKIVELTISNINDKLKMKICGSYRRKNISCGDIDILITNIDLSDKIKYLPILIEKLTNIGFLVDHLTKKGYKKYMGICKLNTINIARRIDIRMINYDAYYAAMIYFTGSRDFNIKIRQESIKKGYSLSEYGLRNNKTKEILKYNNEKDIFIFLGMDYIKPIDRN